MMKECWNYVVKSRLIVLELKEKFNVIVIVFRNLEIRERLLMDGYIMLY